jgi:type I restriction enzyme, S subunit
MIYDLKPYPAYKDSGVPWLGEVPTHWEVKRAKNILRSVDIRSVTGEEELLTVSSERGIVPRRSTIVTMFKAESYIGHKLCWPDDLVINSLWAWARGLGVSRHHGIVSTAYGVYRLRTGAEVDSMYIHELVRSAPFHWELQVRSKGVWTSRLQLTDDSFLGAPFPVPPLPEQTAIVRFLDHVDQRIRRYIRAKQKLIKLLEEQKQAIIHRAVTCGLDTNVRLKSSGNQWFSMAPVHWEVLPMRRVILRSVDGPHHSPEYFDNGIPFLSARNIKADHWSLDDVKFISESDYNEFCKRVKPEIGNVLYTKGGTTGVARAVDLDFKFQVWVHVAVLKLNKRKITADFLAAVLNSPRCYEQSQLFTRGATNQDLGLNRMKDIILPVPPIREQEAIMAFVNTATLSLLGIIDRTRREISLLREYRARLITNVVIGKLDVREAAANLPDDVKEPDQLEEAEAMAGDGEEVEGADLDVATEEAEA